jgi:acetyltransferase-like isoleucine patch superfamily enzyme
MLMAWLRHFFALTLRAKAWIRGWAYRLLIIACGGQCGPGLRVDRGLLWKYPPHAGIVIGSHVNIGRDVIIDVPPGGELCLGDHVKLTGYSVIAAYEKVVIGADTLIGELVSIRDADHGMKKDTLIRLQDMTALPVTIGRDVWLGRGVTVLRGATIGDGAIVGANALVLATKIPNNSISVGSPLRHVRDRA